MKIKLIIKKLRDKKVLAKKLPVLIGELLGLVKSLLAKKQSGERPNRSSLMAHDLSSKILSEKKIKNISFKGLTSLLLLSTFMAACNNSNNGRGNLAHTPRNWGYMGGLCSTCGVSGNWMGLVGTDSENGLGTISMGLDFYGTPSGPIDFMDPKVPLFYTGPVVAKGVLSVRYQESLLCYLPPGQYQLSTFSQGQWQSGVLSTGRSGYGPSNLKMEARGMNGVSAVVSLPKGIIYNPSGVSSLVVNRLSGTLVVEQVNGMPCQTAGGLPAYTELF